MVYKFVKSNLHATSPLLVFNTSCRIDVYIKSTRMTLVDKFSNSNLSERAILLDFKVALLRKGTLIVHKSLNNTYL